jgi:hypothetical protein
MSQLKYVCILSFKKNGTVLFESEFEIQSRITRKVEMLEPFRLHILSSGVIPKRNRWWKNFGQKITLFSMAVSSDHNSAEPRPRARRPIYTWPTTYEEPEYLIEIQKFFVPFSLLLPRLIKFSIFLFYFKNSLIYEFFLY